jgi:peptidoglycan hydrolase-like protein with peptidoglycan-binding domain
MILCKYDIMILESRDFHNIKLNLFKKGCCFILLNLSKSKNSKKTTITKIFTLLLTLLMVTSLILPTMTVAQASVNNYTPPGDNEILTTNSAKHKIYWLQEALKALGYDPGPIDGILGPKTTQATRNYQSANGLVADGIAGPKTIASLKSRLAQRTMQSTQLTAKQQQLVNTAMKYVGNTTMPDGSGRKVSGLCQAWVYWVHVNSGMGTQWNKTQPTARDAFNAWKVSTSSQNIPVGATVYFNTSSAAHVGIMLPNNQVIHAVDQVRIHDFDTMVRTYGSFLGWGWNGGAPLN